MTVTETRVPNWLEIDPAQAAHDIETSIRSIVFWILRRKGTVIGLSGGIDSSVVAALCVRALGPNCVLGLLMPEKESSDDARRLAGLLADTLHIHTVLEDLTSTLEAVGCYERRDAAIRRLVPDFGPGHKCKIVVPGYFTGARYNIPSLVVENPAGIVSKVRLDVSAYLSIVAANNFKQRIRKSVEYYHADRLQYAVAGTPNRLEYDQGFFVKNGDGAADLKPIAHLYKSQVYQLARYLRLPKEICERPATTDTFSLPQSQEEFFFSVPLRIFDFCLYGKNHGIAAAEVASMTGIPCELVDAVYSGIDSRRRATSYLHQPALLVDEVTESGRAAVALSSRRN